MSALFLLNQAMSDYLFLSTQDFDEQPLPSKPSSRSQTFSQRATRSIQPIAIISLIILSITLSLLLLLRQPQPRSCNEQWSIACEKASVKKKKRKCSSPNTFFNSTFDPSLRRSAADVEVQRHVRAPVAIQGPAERRGGWGMGSTLQL